MHNGFFSMSRKNVQSAIDESLEEISGTNEYILNTVGDKNNETVHHLLAWINEKSYCYGYAGRKLVWSRKVSVLLYWKILLAWRTRTSI